MTMTMTKRRLTDRQFATLPTPALATHLSHLRVRAAAPGIPAADHSHSRQIARVETEIARRGVVAAGQE